MIVYYTNPNMLFKGRDKGLDTFGLTQHQMTEIVQLMIEKGVIKKFPGREHSKVLWFDYDLFPENYCKLQEVIDREAREEEERLGGIRKVRGEKSTPAASGLRAVAQ